LVNSTLWTQGIADDKKSEFLQILALEKDSKVLEQLLFVIRQKRLTLELSEISDSYYENASCAYQQAHKNGAKQMLYFIEKLLTNLS